MIQFRQRIKESEEKIMVGRIAEQAELRALLDNSESVFAAVYGRRRVGKTYLVRKTFGNHFAAVRRRHGS